MKEEIEDKLIKKVEEKIEALLNNELRQDNVDYLYKLVDIHKDLMNEKYWKKKEENMDMIYRTSGNYGRDNYGTDSYGRERDSHGRFMGNYGRRYRGHDMIDDMADNYGTYMDNVTNGRYGSPETEKSFDYMLQSAEDFFEHLFKESDSPEQVEKIKRVARRIADKRV